MPPLRIAIIGCGGITQMMHLPYLLDHPEKFQVVAISDVSESVVQAVGLHFGIAARYTDWRAMLAHPGIEAVCIAHSGSHHDTVMGAMDAGVHIFVEKPLGWNVRETRAIAERAAQYNKIIQLAYHKIYDPATAYVKEQIATMRDLGYARITVLHPADELGRSPYRIRGANGAITEGHVDTGTWAEQVALQLRAFTGGTLAPLVDESLGARKGDARLRLGYAILAQSMIHQIYMLHELLGAPERVLHTDIWRDGLSIHALLAYPNDLRVTLDWHYLQHLKDYQEEYAFFGNHDRVTLTLPSPYFRNFPSPVTIQGHEGELTWTKQVIVSYDEAFRRELIAFHDNVTRHCPPHTGVADALRHAELTQQLIDAAV